MELSLHDIVINNELTTIAIVLLCFFEVIGHWVDLYALSLAVLPVYVDEIWELLLLNLIKNGFSPDFMEVYPIKGRNLIYL